MGVDLSREISRAPVSHVEVEQKFLVDAEAFARVSGSLRRRQIRQCYVAVEGDGVGWEVRFREEATDAVDCRRFEPATVRHAQTLKRLRSADGVSRDEIEFAVDAEVFEAVWSASARRVEKTRYSGDPVGDWTVDVFTSGPLQGVVVAELEVPDVTAYLATRGYPQWVVTTPICQLPHATYIPVDLTSERVNLVAAGVAEPSLRLSQLLAEQRMRREGAARRVYAAAPTTRQGVRDLDRVRR